MEIDKQPFLTVFSAREYRETVENGSRNHFVELDHRAEATVLMRSLRAFRASPLNVRSMDFQKSANHRLRRGCSYSFLRTITCSVSSKIKRLITAHSANGI